MQNARSVRYLGSFQRGETIELGANVDKPAREDYTSGPSQALPGLMSVDGPNDAQRTRRGSACNRSR